MADDHLDFLRARLAGYVDPVVLDAAIAEIRREFGGQKAYIHSLCRDRVAGVRAGLVSGVPVMALADRFKISRQNIYYHRKKVRDESLALFI